MNEQERFEGYVETGNFNKVISMGASLASKVDLQGAAFARAGGLARGKQKKAEAAQVASQVLRAATELYDDGKPRHRIAGILARREGMPAERSIRAVLRRKWGPAPNGPLIPE